MAEKQPETIRRIGVYDVLEKIGQGGMSTVFKGRDSRNQQIVAIKIASRAVINDPFASKRFELEYQVAQDLHHHNLARVFDCGKQDEIPFLVMEFVDGMSLLHRLKAHGPLPEHAARSVLLQVADALTYLHSRQIIHRDIKPDNILLSSQGQAKLMDLGLSKQLESLADLTRSHIGLGTMQFASPEQFDDARSADARSDVYALAATMYQTLTGELPFGLGGPFSVLERKLNNQFDPPSNKIPDLHPSVDAAIRLGMQADRNFRPVSPQEFVALWTGALPIPKVSQLPGTPPGMTPKSRVSGNLGNDRRASIRFLTDFESNCRPMMGPAKQRWQAAIKDISTTGVRLWVKRRFEVGSVLDIMFALQADGGVVSQLVKVRRIVESDTNDAWLLGCEFVNPITEEELESFFHDRMNKTDLI